MDYVVCKLTSDTNCKLYNTAKITVTMGLGAKRCLCCCSCSGVTTGVAARLAATPVATPLQLQQLFNHAEVSGQHPITRCTHVHTRSTPSAHLITTSWRNASLYASKKFCIFYLTLLRHRERKRESVLIVGGGREGRVGVGGGIEQQDILPLHSYPLCC